MKQIILFNFLCCFVVTNAMHPLRERLVSLNTISVMRDVYRTYTPSEKKIVWEDKLSQVIALNSWNTTQMSLLQELKQKLSTANFEEGNNGMGEFKANLETWSTSALNVFTPIQLYNMFAVPHDYINVDMVAGGNSSDCECNKGSAVSCVFNYAGKCDKTSCGSSSSGCGFMWLWDCDGMCVDGGAGVDKTIGQ